MDSRVPRWSSDVHQADWIGPRLGPWEGDYTAAIVMPAGFEAYARVLHPAQIAQHGNRLVRWADVAAWSGLPLRPDAQFHSIALPPTARSEPPPYRSQGPRDGSLSVPDAEVLAGILRDWTAMPEDCWFGVSDTYGWVTSLGYEGPRVQLPHRGYLLYQGATEAVLTLPALNGTFGQCPNLWWPADRAWFVASEIDLPWTYVGGSRGLIDAILADDRIEALPATSNDPVNWVEDWVTVWVDQLFEGLLADNEASLSTPLGTLEARLRPGDLSIEVARHDGSTGSSWHRLDRGEENLPGDLRSYLTRAVLSLTGK